jgi:hypothetical protein
MDYMTWYEMLGTAALCAGAAYFLLWLLGRPQSEDLHDWYFKNAARHIKPKKEVTHNDSNGRKDR